MKVAGLAAREAARERRARAAGHGVQGWGLLARQLFGGEEVPVDEARVRPSVGATHHEVLTCVRKRGIRREDLIELLRLDLECLVIKHESDPQGLDDEKEAEEQAETARDHGQRKDQRACRSEPES